MLDTPTNNEHNDMKHYKHIDNPLFFLEMYCTEDAQINEEIYRLGRNQDGRNFREAAAAAVALSDARLRNAPKRELKKLEERLEELTMLWEHMCEFSRLRRRAIELQDEYGQRSETNAYPVSL